MRFFRRSSTTAHDDPHVGELQRVDKPVRRTLWRTWRSLLWTSTVASACTTSRVQTGPLPEALPAKQRAELKLSLRSGGEITIYDAIFVQDSIVGFDKPLPRPSAQRIAVARADVETVATKSFSLGKTILAVIGGTFALLSFVLLVACASYL